MLLLQMLLLPMAQPLPPETPPTERRPRRLLRPRRLPVPVPVLLLPTVQPPLEASRRARELLPTSKALMLLLLPSRVLPVPRLMTSLAGKSSLPNNSAAGT